MRRTKKVCKILIYIEHLLILAWTVTRFVSISSFASLVGIPVGAANSVITIKTSIITAGIKKVKDNISEKETQWYSVACKN